MLACFRIGLVLALTGFIASGLYASDHETSRPSSLVQWSSSNFQYLYGANWDLGDAERDLITFEVAAGLSFGDTFAFVDIANLTTQGDGSDTSLYGEWAPRLSSKKIFGVDFQPEHTLVSDLLAAFQLNYASNGSLSYLYGVGVDLELPGFAFFNANAYLRDDVDIEGETWQVTLAWKRPFSFAEVDFVAEGFADFIGPEADTEEIEALIVPRLLVDSAPFFNIQPGQLYFGFEFTIWINEFGIKDQNEFVPQLMLKLVF